MPVNHYPTKTSNMFYKEEKFEEYIFVKLADSKWACRETSGTYALHQKERTNDSISVDSEIEV